MFGKINSLETLTSKLNNLEFDESLLNSLKLLDVEDYGEEEKLEGLNHQEFGKYSHEIDHFFLNPKDQT